MSRTILLHSSLTRTGECFGCGERSSLEGLSITTATYKDAAGKHTGNRGPSAFWFALRSSCTAAVCAPTFTCREGPAHLDDASVLTRAGPEAGVSHYQPVPSQEENPLD